MITIINIENLYKSFGDINVINNISLKISEGMVFGLLGPSGSGKTTLIKLIIGQLRPTSGKIFINNESSTKYTEKTLSSFGMMLDQDGLYERLSCYDNLDIFARIHNIKNKRQSILTTLEKVKLYNERRKTVSAFSKGMRQRLVLARALLHSPKILFLDEPTSGLDPATSQAIHGTMSELKRKGVTIFLTTHNMSEAHKMCDIIALLNDGRVIEYGIPSEICLKYSQENQIDIKIVGGDTIHTTKYDILEVLTKIKSQKLEIASIHSKELNLEDVFIELTGRELI